MAPSHPRFPSSASGLEWCSGDHPTAAGGHWLRALTAGGLLPEPGREAGASEGRTQPPPALADTRGQRCPFTWRCLDQPALHIRAQATSRSRTNDRPTVLQERNPRRDAPRVGDLPSPQHTRAPPANGRLTCAPSRSASPRPRPEEGHAAPRRPTPQRRARSPALGRRRVARPQACAQGAYNPPPKESSARGGLAGLAMTLTGCRLRPRGGTSGSALEPLGDLPQLKRRAEPGRWRVGGARWLLPPPWP